MVEAKNKMNYKITRDKREIYMRIKPTGPPSKA